MNTHAYYYFVKNLSNFAFDVFIDLTGSTNMSFSISSGKTNIHCFSKETKFLIASEIKNREIGYTRKSTLDIKILK